MSYSETLYRALLRYDLPLLLRNRQCPVLAALFFYIILLHNHPSGDPMPSREDILVTQRIREGGSLLGIELLDHIIIGDNCYVSLAEQKLLKEK